MSKRGRIDSDGEEPPPRASLVDIGETPLRAVCALLTGAGVRRGRLSFSSL